MSVQAISAALALRGVSSSEKLLLLALANYADESMRCWPSQVRLAEDTCLTDRTVRALLAALEGRGLVSRKEQRRRDGSRASDLITLHLQQPETISGGAEIASGGPEVVSGLTTFEPPKEPSKDICSPEFLAFWEAYPAKVGKKAAWKAWKAAKDRPPLASILASLARYIAAKPADRDWCHPTTWINQGRWDDEHTTTAPDTTDWPDLRWQIAVNRWRADGSWPEGIGPAPGQPGCRCPASLYVTEADSFRMSA